MLKPGLTKEKLRQAIDDADQAIEEATLETIAALRKFLKRYIRNFKAALIDLELADDSEIFALVEQERLVRTITALLAESGYSEVIEEFERGLNSVGGEAIAFYERYSVAATPFLGLSTESLEALAQPFLDELDFQLDRLLVRPLEAAVRNSFLTLKTRQEIVRDIAGVIAQQGIVTQADKAFTILQIETLVTESDRRFMELVRLKQAEQLGLDVVIYSGPLDSVTSEQCKFLLGQPYRAGASKKLPTQKPDIEHGAPGFWYKDEIRAGMHPDLVENPLVARGHYNCRHQWLPVDEAAAKRLDPRFEPRGDG